MNNMNIFIMMDPGSLTKEQRASTISYLVFLKDKRSDQIKGQACANRRKQRSYISKEYLDPPQHLQSLY